jgi:flagellar FliJ protein
MKPRESALRLMRFEAREKARKVADLEAMIHEFEVMIADLDRQISNEEERTGIRDAKHFAYSTFAKAARQRRDNLQLSVDDLRDKLTIAVQERDEATESLDKAENPDSRDASPRGRRIGERNPDALAS